MTINENVNTHKTTARIVGILFIIGTVSGILSVVFGATIITDPDYLVEISANENQVILGAFFVLVMGLALSMIPVVMYPIFKKYQKTLALGHVVFRGALETVCYIAIVLSWLLLITVSHEFVKAGAPDGSYLQTLGALLLAVGEWIDPVSQIIFALGALMFYYLFYRSKLIPRWLSGWGLIGAIVTLTSALINLFGSAMDWMEFLLAVNEMVLALWLIVKGFDSAAIAKTQKR